MGEFVGTVKVKKPKKGLKAHKKAAAVPRRIRVVGRTRDPRTRDALIRDLKKLAAKYRFPVRKSKR